MYGDMVSVYMDNSGYRIDAEYKRLKEDRKDMLFFIFIVLFICGAYLISTASGLK